MNVYINTPDGKREYFKVHGNTKVKNILKATCPDLDCGQEIIGSFGDVENRLGEIPALRKVIIVFVTVSYVHITTIRINTSGRYLRYSNETEINDDD